MNLSPSKLSKVPGNTASIRPAIEMVRSIEPVLSASWICASFEVNLIDTGRPRSESGFGGTSPRRAMIDTMRVMNTERLF
jgi:hypothetical protein